MDEVSSDIIIVAVSSLSCGAESSVRPRLSNYILRGRNQKKPLSNIGSSIRVIYDRSWNGFLKPNVLHYRWISNRLTMAVVNRQAQHHDGIMLITSERPAVSLSLVWKKNHQIFFQQDSYRPGNKASQKADMILKSYWCLDLDIYSLRGRRDPRFGNNGAPARQQQGHRVKYPVQRYYPREAGAPSPSPTWAADWTSFVFLPTSQAALMAASSEARLNLASRIWQEDASRVGRKQPKDEYTSALPKQDDWLF